MTVKSRKIKFNAAAAYNADPDDSSMGQSSPAAASASPAGASSSPADGSSPDGSDSSSASSGQPVTFPPEQVAQMEQFKQSGDFQSLGQYVAQYLP